MTQGTDVDDLCFAARALAQTHAMTEQAHRYRQACLERERERQPVTELADWAATALLVGYCLRRTEESKHLARSAEPAAAAESAAGWPQSAQPAPPAPSAQSADSAHPRPQVDLAAVTALSEELRVGEPGAVSLLSAETTIAALDRIIATELDKRREHLREQLDDAAWRELEDYIAWWVVHGYALRASEQPER